MNESGPGTTGRLTAYLTEKYGYRCIEFPYKPVNIFTAEIRVSDLASQLYQWTVHILKSKKSDLQDSDFENVNYITHSFGALIVYRMLMEGPFTLKVGQLHMIAPAMPQSGYLLLQPARLCDDDWFAFTYHCPENGAGRKFRVQQSNG